MRTLVTRFHILLLMVTLAITGVAVTRIPSDFIFAAHWRGSTLDWLWPRNAIFVAPILQLLLMVLFFILGRALTKNHYSKTQHILDPLLTLLMLVVLATQFGLLLVGIGSDLDFVRLTGFALGFTLMLLGVVLFGAERHTYAGLRMPWPIPSDRTWTAVHRTAGGAYILAGVSLGVIAWLDFGLGALTFAYAAAMVLPGALSAALTLAMR